MNTSAVFDDGRSGQVVLHFALPLKDPGVTVLSGWDTLGMRGARARRTSRSTVYFVPDAAIAATRPAATEVAPTVST